MIQVCQDLPVLPDRWESRRDHLRQRSREETRGSQVSQVLQVIPATPDPPVPLEARKETKENQERQENEVNQEKMATRVLQVSLGSKESPDFQVPLAGMERED